MQTCLHSPLLKHLWMWGLESEIPFSLCVWRSQILIADFRPNWYTFCWNQDPYPMHVLLQRDQNEWLIKDINSSAIPCFKYFSCWLIERHIKVEESIDCFYQPSQELTYRTQQSLTPYLLDPLTKHIFGRCKVVLVHVYISLVTVSKFLRTYFRAALWRIGSRIQEVHLSIPQTQIAHMFLLGSDQVPILAAKLRAHEQHSFPIGGE